MMLYGFTTFIYVLIIDIFVTLYPFIEETCVLDVKEMEYFLAASAAIFENGKAEEFFSYERPKSEFGQLRE